MKTKTLIWAVASAAMASMTHTSFAASSPVPVKSIGYWYDSSGQPIRNAQGNCVHTASWRPQVALAACDPTAARPAVAASSQISDADRRAEPPTHILTAEESQNLSRLAEARPEDDEMRLGSMTVVVPGQEGTEPDGLNTRREDLDRRDEALAATEDDDGLMGPSNIVTNTHFAFDRAEISYDEEKRLDDMVGQLAKLPEDTLIQVTGHADAIGDSEYNIDLSMRRAKALREYLVSNGIEPKRIVIAALGESEPVASNDTPEGRALNRRAELQITRLAQLDPTDRTQLSTL